METCWQNKPQLSAACLFVPIVFTRFRPLCCSVTAKSGFSCNVEGFSRVCMWTQFKCQFEISPRLEGKHFKWRSEIFQINVPNSRCLYINRSQQAEHTHTHTNPFPPSPSSPRHAESLWQVNKINIHLPVAVAGMSGSLSCHQLCVFVCFDVCVCVRFPPPLAQAVTFSWDVKALSLSFYVYPFPKHIAAHMGSSISLAHCVPEQLMAAHHWGDIVQFYSLVKWYMFLWESDVLDSSEWPEYIYRPVSIACSFVCVCVFSRSCFNAVYTCTFDTSIYSWFNDH